MPEIHVTCGDTWGQSGTKSLKLAYSLLCFLVSAITLDVSCFVGRQTLYNLLRSTMELVLTICFNRLMCGALVWCFWWIFVVVSLRVFLGFFFFGGGGGHS